MRYPIKFKGRQCLPGNKCDYCHAKPTSPEFVSLAVGVTQDYAKSSAVDLSHTFVSMQLDWQGSSENQGIGFGVVDAVGGGCVLNFCSTDCMRLFLNACVDHLEQLIQKTKQK